MKPFNTETLTRVILEDISVGDVITVFATYNLHPSVWIPDVRVIAAGVYGITGEEENHFGVGTCVYYKTTPTLPTTQGEYIIIDEIHCITDEEQVDLGTVAMYDSELAVWEYWVRDSSALRTIKPNDIIRWRPLDTK